MRDAEKMRPAALLRQRKTGVTRIIISDEKSCRIVSQNALRHLFPSGFLNRVKACRGSREEPAPAIDSIDAETGFVGMLDGSISDFLQNIVVLIVEFGFNGMEEFLNALSGDNETVLRKKHFFNLLERRTHSVFEKEDKGNHPCAEATAGDGVLRNAADFLMAMGAPLSFNEVSGGDGKSPRKVEDNPFVRR